MRDRTRRHIIHGLRHNPQFSHVKFGRRVHHGRGCVQTAKALPDSSISSICPTHEVRGLHIPHHNVRVVCHLASIKSVEGDAEGYVHSHARTHGVHAAHAATGERASSLLPASRLWLSAAGRPGNCARVVLSESVPEFCVFSRRWLAGTVERPRKTLRLLLTRQFFW